VARIVNEPTAAAIAHGFDNVGEAGRLLVFDLGGGTFDVTIIDIGADGALEVVGTGGDRELGGADFDQLIYDEMVKAAAKAGMDITADPWTRQDAYAKAEDIKKELSTAPSATRPITAGGRPIAFTLERTRFERLLADHLRGVEDITLHTIEKAGLTPPDLTKVLMVGGSSRIPAFQELLSRVCGQPPSLSRNLDEDVARGAAILATKLSGEASPRSQLATMPVPVDVASHGIGVSALDEDTGILRNAVIMSGGTTVPASAEQTFFTVANNQTQIEVVLNEGDDDDLEFVRELGKSTARFRRPVPKDHPIRVSIEFTVEQIIRMRAFDGRDGTLLCEIEVQREGLLSSREKNQARQLLAKMEIK
jgi:molecular chaperone DnaK